MASTTALVWFATSASATDPAWAAATAAADRVVPLYVLDPVALSSAGVLRRDLLLGHLAALRRDLRRTRRRAAGPSGRSDDDRAQYRRRGGGDEGVRRCRRVGLRQTAGRRHQLHSLAADGITVEWHWGSHVHAPGRVVSPSTGAPHHVFTPFHRSWSWTTWEEWPEPGEATIARVRGGVELPLPRADPVMAPGEDAAERRLGASLGHVDRYADAHDLPADPHGTSHLSADLRWGTLSPRHVVEVVGSTDPGRATFTRQVCSARLVSGHGPRGPDAVDPRHEAGDGSDPLACRPGRARGLEGGRTGYPIVDAGMRQLAETGWMHNRIRLITAGSWSRTC